MESRFRRTAARFAQSGLARAFLACAALALCSSCSDPKALQRTFRPKLTAENDKSSLTVDQLEAAIKDYASASERSKLGDAALIGVEAAKNLGKYRIILADRYMEAGLFKDAYDVLTLAMQSFTDDARLYYSAGLCAGHVAKTFEAKGAAGAADKARWLAVSESSYKRALALNPRSTQAMYAAAVLYSFELDRPAEALSLLSTLLGIETRNVDAMLLMGRASAQAGRIEDAIHWYETAAETTVVAEKKKVAEDNRAKLLAEQGAANGK